MQVGLAAAERGGVWCDRVAVARLDEHQARDRNSGNGWREAAIERTIEERIGPRIFDPDHVHRPRVVSRGVSGDGGRQCGLLSTGAVRLEAIRHPAFAISVEAIPLASRSCRILSASDRAKTSASSSVAPQASRPCRRTGSVSLPAYRTNHATCSTVMSRAISAVRCPWYPKLTKPSRTPVTKCGVCASNPAGSHRPRETMFDPQRPIAPPQSVICLLYTSPSPRD